MQFLELKPHVCTDNLQYQGLDVVVCDPLNVTVSNLVAIGRYAHALPHLPTAAYLLVPYL